MASLPYVFTVRDNAASPPGTRKTGLTPAWVFLKRLSDLADVAQPSIIEIAQGQYGFAFDTEALGESSGQIDAGNALTNPSDRYIDVLLTRDSSRIQTALPNQTAGNANGGLAVYQPAPQTGNPQLVGAGEDVYRYGKTNVAGLGTGTFGRFEYDQLSKIGTAGGTVNTPVGADEKGNAALFLAVRDDYTNVNGQPIELTLPSDWKDITAVPLANISLGFGPVFGDDVNVYVSLAASAIVASGAPPAVQTVRFEPPKATTQQLPPGDQWGATLLVNYPAGGGRRSTNYSLTVRRSFVP